MQGCEREVAEANEGASEERKNESIMRLSWALVHSRQSEDINRGIAMLEGKSSAKNFYGFFRNSIELSSIFVLLSTSWLKAHPFP